MNYRMLEIPDEPSRLADWLERELVGPNLGHLVQELTVVHRGNLIDATSRDLESWLGGERASVLQSGLTGLPAARLRSLFGQPELLLALQELILTDGGEYWQQLLQNEPAWVDATERVRTKLFGNMPNSSDAVMPLSQPGARHRAQWLGPLVAVAAVILLAVGIAVWRHTRPNPTWGWNRSDLLTASDLSPREYLESLATAGQAWFDRRPADNAGLAQRIRELRQGCDRLIAHNHPSLSPVDRDWLVQRCRDWRTKFDQQLFALEQGTEPESVRTEMDQIVKQLVAKLQERAQQLAT